MTDNSLVIYTKTDYIVNYNNRVILCDTPSGNITVILPDLTQFSQLDSGAEFTFYIKKINAANTVTVVAINGSQSVESGTLTGLNEVKVYKYSYDGIYRLVSSVSSGGGGGETLAQTLVLGNTTGGTNIEVSAGDDIIINDATASRVAVIGASKEVDSSSTTLTQLSYLDATSSIQTQIDNITSEQWTEIVMVGGDQTTTSAAAQNITELVSGTLSANTRYKFRGEIRTACNNTGGIKFAVTVPTGTTFACFFTGRLAGSAVTANMGSLATGASGTLSGQALNTFSGSAVVYVSVEFAVSATSGAAQFQFASGVAGQTSTIHQDGTLLEYKEIP